MFCVFHGFSDFAGDHLQGAQTFEFGSWRNQGLSDCDSDRDPDSSAWKNANKWIRTKGLDKYIHLIGSIDQDNHEMTDLYNGASIFVFPSFYEGWTAPPLEAMACGTPVITSNCSSLPETVKDAAIKVFPNKIEELAYRMENLLSNESLRKHFIKKGLDHAASHTWENASKKMIEVFTDMKLRGPWN